MNFWVKMLIPKTHFYPILTSFLDYIYIKALIFTRIIIISAQVKLSPRPNVGGLVQADAGGALVMLSTAGGIVGVLHVEHVGDLHLGALEPALHHLVLSGTPAVRLVEHDSLLSGGASKTAETARDLVGVPVH